MSSLGSTLTLLVYKLGKLLYLTTLAFMLAKYLLNVSGLFLWPFISYKSAVYWHLIDLLQRQQFELNAFTYWRNLIDDHFLNLVIVNKSLNLVSGFEVKSFCFEGFKEFPFLADGTCWTDPKGN